MKKKNVVKKLKPAQGEGICRASTLLLPWLSIAVIFRVPSTVSSDTACDYRLNILSLGAGTDIDRFSPALNLPVFFYLSAFF